MKRKRIQRKKRKKVKIRRGNQETREEWQQIGKCSSVRWIMVVVMIMINIISTISIKVKENKDKR